MTKDTTSLLPPVAASSPSPAHQVTSASRSFLRLVYFSLCACLARSARTMPPLIGCRGAGAGGVSAAEGPLSSSPNSTERKREGRESVGKRRAGSCAGSRTRAHSPHTAPSSTEPSPHRSSVHQVETKNGAASQPANPTPTAIILRSVHCRQIQRSSRSECTTRSFSTSTMCICITPFSNPATRKC